MHRKMLAVVLVLSMFMIMNTDAFAEMIMDASGNVYSLHRYSSYAVAETDAESAGWYCSVTVTAFNGNAGNSNMSYGYGYAGANAYAPSSRCTRSTSTHSASMNGIYYSRTLNE